MTFVIFDPDNYTTEDLQELLNCWKSGHGILIDIAEPEKLQKILADNGIKAKFRNQYPADKFGSLGRWVFKKE